MLDCDVERTRKSHIRLMFNTLAVLSYILEDVDTGRATTLRDLNDGAETVPTVILPDGSAVTNPAPGLVIAVLTSDATASRPRRAVAE